jgi:hypothetical protein
MSEDSLELIPLYSMDLRRQAKAIWGGKQTIWRKKDYGKEINEGKQE